MGTTTYMAMNSMDPTWADKVRCKYNGLHYLRLASDNRITNTNCHGKDATRDEDQENMQRKRMIRKRCNKKPRSRKDATRDEDQENMQQ